MLIAGDDRCIGRGSCGIRVCQRPPEYDGFRHFDVFLSLSVVARYSTRWLLNYMIKYSIFLVYLRQFANAFSGALNFSLVALFTRFGT